MPRSKRWPAVLLGAGCLVLALFSVAGWRLVDQEKMLESVRLRERLENAASLVVRESERALAQAASDSRTSLSIQWDEHALQPNAGVPLLWSPAPDQQPEAQPQHFTSGEQLEFAGMQPERAIAAYRNLLRSPNAGVRAGALLRIARCQRTLRHPGDALETYHRLAAMGAVRVAGAPAELVSYRERAMLFDAANDFAAASREREKLKAVLEKGANSIDRPTFEFYAQGIGISSEAIAWAEAMEQLWERASEAARGTAIVAVRNGRFVAEWARDGRQGKARIVDFEAMRQRLARALEGSQVHWQLKATGSDLAGQAPLSGSLLTRKSGETNLPWEVTVAVPPESGPSRGALLISALVVLGLAILGTVYLAYRVVRRELRVAEMQSEFVATVSHEFRTPITALTHLTDLLVSGDPAADRRALYYKALARETGRLREMVENLLDFGRIEAGRYKYKPQDVNAEVFVRSLVQEFQEQPSATGREVVFEADSGPSTVSVDCEAMRGAIWNLLDNAAKYSPAGTRITTQVSAADGWTSVSVRDEGPGITNEDRKRIFQKFVRGRAQGRETAKGTGIGLAMVQAIVHAHGGRVELESQPGAGSRFTILLPPERRS
jgi:signal transduction histidine kinase